MTISLFEACATLSWSLDVECPLCHLNNDLSNDDDDGIVAKAIFNNRWDDLVGEIFTCQECGAEFKLSEVEY